jgi:hypothetical protein
MSVCPLPNSLNELTEYAKQIGLGPRASTEVLRAFMQKNRNLPMGAEPIVPTNEEFKALMDSMDVWNTEGRQVVMPELYTGFGDKMNAFPEYSVLVNPIKLDSQSQSNLKAAATVTVLAEKLSGNLGVPYQFITPQEAANLTQNVNQWKGQAAFYLGGTVYMIPELITEKTVLHEFAHPLVRAIRISNPALFNKLATELKNTPAGLVLLQNARAAYDTLTENDPIILEEALVMSLTNQAVENSDSAFNKFIKNFLFALRQLLRKIFGDAQEKVKVENLDQNTTLADLGNMLVLDQFDINLEGVSQEDVAAYASEVSDYVNALKAFNDNDLQRSTNLFFTMIKKQINLLEKNKDYEGMKKILKDAFDRSDLEEIFKNLAPYQDISSTLTNEMSKLTRDAEFARKHTEAFINSLLRTKYMVRRLNTELVKLVKDPNSQSNVAKVFYYNNIINYWENFLQDFQKNLDAAGIAGDIDGSNPIYELLGSLGSEIKTARNHTNKIYFAGTSSLIKDTLTPMKERIDQRFNELIEDLKKRGAPASIIELRQKDYWGLSGDALKNFLALKARVDNGDQLSSAEKEVYERLKDISYKDGAYLTDEKIEYLMMGRLGDAHALNSFLEGFIYNQDPVVFGFATFVKNRMTDVFTEAQRKGNAFLTEVKPLLESAGYSQSNPAAFGRRATFIDKKGSKNKSTGLYESKDVNTLLNPFKDYREDMDRMRNEIRIAEEKAIESGNTDEVLKLKLAKQKFEREYFHTDFTKEYYARYEVFRKGDNDEVGARAEAARNEVLAKIQNITTGMSNQTTMERLDAVEELDMLWREYRQLHSNYLPSGELKRKEDLEVAERLREFRDISRELYREELLPDLFTNSLAAHEQFLIDRNYEKNSPAFNRLREKWIMQNTRVKIKDSFYVKQKLILDEIKSIMSRLPKDATVEKDISDLYEKLSQLMSPYRDDDMQPEATAMDIRNIAEIKRTEQLLEQAKKNIAKASGLTANEHEILSNYFARLKNGEDVTPEDRMEANDLLVKKSKNELNQNDRKRLYELWEELADLQTSVPTDYYVDTINNLMSYVDLEEMQERFKFKDIDKSNANQVLTEDFLNFLDEQNDEVAEWFRTNHIMSKATDKDGNEYIKIQRVKAWSVTRPRSAEYLETHEFTNSDGETEVLPSIPNMTYYDRIVKDKYVTQPVTMLEALEMGDPTLANKDNKGNWLPRLDAPDDRYVNHQYFDVAKNDKALHAAIVALSKWHLQFQEGNPDPSKLYLDVPRFMRSGYEANANMFTVEGKVQNPISSWIKRVRAFWSGGDGNDYDRGYNFNTQQDMIKGDMFDDQFAGVPINGLADIEAKEVSLDLTYGMMRYMISAEKQRALIEMNPMARALQSVLADPENVVRQVKGMSKDMLDNFSLTNMFERGTKLVTKGEKSVRQKAIDNFVEREFEGKLNKGVIGQDSDNMWVHKMADQIMGASAFGYFAMDIPSALKNSFGLRIQSLIESAGGKYFNHASYAQGTAFSNKVSWEISLEIYKFGPKSHNTQLVEIFDAYQGRFQDKFVEHGSRSLTKDALGGLSWMTSFRKWTELNSTLSIFGAMMHHEKNVTQTINGVTKKIKYIDAWETVDGQIRLKEGVDPEWGIGGSKFKAFKNRVHGVVNNLAGSFAKFDYAEADRYVAFRFAIAFKRWFLRMFMNRLQHRGSLRKGTVRARYDAAVGDTAMGFHLEALMAFGRMIKTRGEYAMFLSDTEKSAILSTIMDVAYVVAFSMAISMLFGFDEKDPEKFAKLRARSGPLPFLGVSDKENPFNASGWLTNHALYMTMQLKNESMQWLPIPGYGADNYIDMLSMESVSMNNTWDNYKKIIVGLTQHAGHQLFGTDDSKAYFDQREGPYDWMQKDGSKVKTYFFRSLGLTGKTLSPDMAITNWVKGQNWR